MTLSISGAMESRPSALPACFAWTSIVVTMRARSATRSAWAAAGNKRAATRSARKTPKASVGQRRATMAWDAAVVRHPCRTSVRRAPRSSHLTRTLASSLPKMIVADRRLRQDHRHDRKSRIARLAEQGEIALVLLGVAETARADEDNGRLAGSNCLFQRANPAQTGWKVVAIEERLQTSGAQRRTDVLGMTPIRARIADEYVVKFRSHDQSP